MNNKFSKVKLSRKIGIPLTPKAERIMDFKPGAPGVQRNRSGRSRETVYKKQLMEKQKVRAWYYVSEKQMRRCYLKAAKLKGDTGANLMRLLELRLVSVLTRSGFAPTIFAARQYISHGHITVNGKKVDIPSYMLSEGDIVAVREKSKKLHIFTGRELTASTVPGFITPDQELMSLKISGAPGDDDISLDAQVSLIVEYYSR